MDVSNLYDNRHFVGSKYENEYYRAHAENFMRDNPKNFPEFTKRLKAGLE